MSPEELRSKIRAKHKRETIDVPGVGSVIIRELTAAELASFAKSDDTPRTAMESAYSAILAATIDEKGEQVFEATEEYRASLRELTEDQVEAWFAPIMELSGISGDVEEKKG